jgi:hypothetical protein
VHDRAQRAVVPADGARAIHVAVDAPAARASRERHADRSPGRQRIAATVAHGRCERKNRSPAGRTDRPRRRHSSSCPQAAQDGARRTGMRESPKTRKTEGRGSRTDRTTPLRFRSVRRSPIDVRDRRTPASRV